MIIRFGVATAKEILHYDKSFHLIRSYSNGFSGIEVLSMLTDNYNNLWFVNHNNNISRLNTQTGKYLSLSEKDGVQKETFPWEHAYTKDVYGNLYFACEKGFYKINPTLFRDKYPATSVYIQSITINQNPFHSNTSANYVQQLFLKHDQNNIAIEVGDINYFAGNNNTIRYKLNGVINNWQYTSAASVINFNGLQPGKYKLIMQSSNAVNDFNNSEKILWISVQTAWWQSWWFYITVTIVTGLIFYSLIRWRVHQKFLNRLNKSEQEKQLAQLKEKTSQLEMQVLRSQMNPHFIFNCLSSISSFILKNKTDEASDYLSKFSRLIRMVLNNSKLEFISLADELETLRLYLEMERLRFKKSFDYNFTYNNTVEPDNIFIPPLLLQPFAENAIWHGLMQKKKQGLLNFDFTRENKFLYCVITDNGIGRLKAEELKSKSAEKQKSMGLKITTERLNLLNNKPNEQTYFTIEDLKNEYEEALGTRVYLKIFFKDIAEM